MVFPLLYTYVAETKPSTRHVSAFDDKHVTLGKRGEPGIKKNGKCSVGGKEEVWTLAPPPPP